MIPYIIGFVMGVIGTLLLMPNKEYLQGRIARLTTEVNRVGKKLYRVKQAIKERDDSIAVLKLYITEKLQLADSKTLNELLTSYRLEHKQDTNYVLGFAKFNLSRNTNNNITERTFVPTMEQVKIAIEKEING